MWAPPQSGLYGLGEVPIQRYHRPLCEPRLLQWHQCVDRHGPHCLHSLHCWRGGIFTNPSHLCRSYPISYHFEGWIHYRGLLNLSCTYTGSDWLPVIRCIILTYKVRIQVWSTLKCKVEKTLLGISWHYSTSPTMSITFLRRAVHFYCPDASCPQSATSAQPP